MYRVARAWSGRCVGLALISLGLCGCGQSGKTKQAAPFGLESSAADTPNVGRLDSALLGDGAAGGSASSFECSADDRSCNGVDDDCNGRVDEDFQGRCVFGTVAATCVNGQIVNERCDDSSVCTIDSCTTQGCRHVQINCDDNNPCTADSCDAVLGCQHTPAIGAACDDGDPCTDGDSCNAAASCQPGAALDVDDGDPCTADSCDPQSGESHTLVVGAVCDDASLCTQNDRCDAAGSCHGTLEPPVDDGNPCTVDACDPLLGQTHTPAIGAACDDGSVCTQSDACTANGSCMGVPLSGLDDSDACTTDICNPVTGAITHTRAAPGTSCSDGNACNGAEVCQGLSELTVTIQSKSTFLRADNRDDVLPATVIRLADYGFGPGRRVRAFSTGTYYAPANGRVQGVFSSNATLLDRTQLLRVPGAIQSDAPQIVTGLTNYDLQTTDIAQDWRAENGGIELTIPAGARYLFVGNSDSFYRDNIGVVQFTLRALQEQCVTGEAPSAGATCTLPSGAAGVCDGVAMCQ
ncbi:MAG TPA: hypothetical protein VJR89_29015 [Polyangiales bacterium]|nr:hypothetical protein [Polyangiales bacterium]